MKKINKENYKEARYGRKTLLTVSLVGILLSLCVLGGGIALIVVGATSGVLSKIIWMSVVGGLLTLLGLIFGAFSSIMLFTSFGMIKALEGNVKDGNRAIGTINIVKCDKCGEELPDNAIFCNKCGTSVEGDLKCECGTSNKLDAEYCINCGKKLK